MISNRYLIALFFLPFISFGQWIRPYITGQGLGYSYSSKHSSFYGIVEDDTLTVLGEQVFGPRSSPWHEYIRDQYDARTGQFISSEILYPYDGSPTAHRPGQRFFPNANGFIVSHRTMGSYTDSLHYLRDKYGNVQRIDSMWYTLIYNGQTVDSTHSYLVKDTSSNLILRDWNTADTLLFICESCISQSYQGSFDPNQWILAQYHIDGAILYLRYWQPGMVSYGSDILKFDIKTGGYIGHLNFGPTGFIFSSGQKFLYAIEDSVAMPAQADQPYTAYNSIYNGLGQKLSSFSYQGDLYQGHPNNMPFFFMNDSLLVVYNTLHHPYGTTAYKRGTHLRVFTIDGKQIGSAKFVGKPNSRNFIIRRILAMKNGYLYLVTEGLPTTLDLDLLARFPYGLNFKDTLFEVILDSRDISYVNITVYPNPFTDSVKIKSSRLYDQILISSIDGSQSISANYSEDNAYTTESLKSGAYMVTVLFQGKVIHNSLVIKE